MYNRDYISGESPGQESSKVSPIDYDSIAELYDLYVQTDYDVPFFLSEVRRVSGPVIELTCGTGRLSIPLVEAGARLTCVDLACGMLAVLERKLKSRGLEAEVLCADATRLALPPGFDLALLPFQAFMEFVGEENQAALLASVYALLNPGGRFICTLHNPAVRRAQVDGSLRIVRQVEVEGGTLVVSGFEQGGQPVVERLQYFEFFGPDGRLAWKQALTMRFAFVEREDFERLALAAGFELLQCYGDYQRSPFDPQRSPAMVWVLGKPV